MGVDIYGLVRMPDGSLGQMCSDETRAYIASVVGDVPVRIDDVRMFDRLKDEQMACYDDPDRGYELWSAIQHHPTLHALDATHLLCFGRVRGELVVYIAEEMGCVSNGYMSTEGRTTDAEDLRQILTLLFDEQRARMLLAVIEGIFWG